MDVSIDINFLIEKKNLRSRIYIEKTLEVLSKKIKWLKMAIQFQPRKSET